MKSFFVGLLLVSACASEPEFDHETEARRVLEEFGLKVHDLSCETWDELARCSAETNAGPKTVMCAYGRCEFRR